MSKNTALATRQHAAVPGGVATKGIYATRAENATLWDADGKEYIDFAAGIAVVNTGHRHPAVEDALVFGVKDETWGQAVTAVVEAHAPVSEAELIAHVKGALAAYKAPKHVVLVQKCPRAPNGKADYDSARKLADSLAA